MWCDSFKTQYDYSYRPVELIVFTDEGKINLSNIGKF
jgi:hypothetical protein